MHDYFDEITSLSSSKGNIKTKGENLIYKIDQSVGPVSFFFMLQERSVTEQARNTCIFCNSISHLKKTRETQYKSVKIFLEFKRYFFSSFHLLLTNKRGDMEEKICSRIF